MKFIDNIPTIHKIKKKKKPLTIKSTAILNKIVVHLVFNEVIMYQVQLYLKIQVFRCLCHKIIMNLRGA